jgi:cell division septation protein DedD
MQWKNRQVKRIRVERLVLTSILAVALMGHAVVSRAAEEESAAQRVTVGRDGVPVYSHMATSGIVVMQLMRGDVVEMEPADTTSEGAWCKVREIAIWGRSGYVRCKELKGEAIRPPKEEVPPVTKGPPESPPSPAEAPAPKPTARVREPEVTGKTGYTVQVAALVVERNALSLKERLEKLGYSPVIHVTTARITRHRVYAGEFVGREEAERTMRRLNVDGFPSKLVEGEGGKVFVQVGSFLKIDEAIDLARELQQKNHTSKIVSGPVPTRIHAVRVGAYESRSEAVGTLDALRSHGFAPVILKQ